MAGSLTFDFNPENNANIQETTTLAISAGEKVRVRFSSKTPYIDVFLVILANGLTSYFLIEDMEAYVIEGLIVGDVVSLQARLNGNARSEATGILEVG